MGLEEDSLFVRLPRLRSVRDLLVIEKDPNDSIFSLLPVGKAIDLPCMSVLRLGQVWVKIVQTGHCRHSQGTPYFGEKGEPLALHKVRHRTSSFQGLKDLAGKDDKRMLKAHH